MAYDDLRPLAALRSMFEADLEPIRQHLARWRATLSAGVPTRLAAKGASENEPLSRSRAILQLMGINAPRRPGPKTQALQSLAPQMSGMIGKAGAAANVFGAIVTAVKSTIDSFTQLRDQQVSHAQNLRRFNGAINEQAALLEKQQLQMSYRTAAATQGSSAKLLESERQRNEAWQGFNEFKTNIQNQLSTGFNRVSESVGEAASTMSKWAQDILVRLSLMEDPKQENMIKQLPFIEWLNDTAAGKFRGPKNGGRP